MVIISHHLCKHLPEGITRDYSFQCSPERNVVPIPLGVACPPLAVSEIPSAGSLVALATNSHRRKQHNYRMFHSHMLHVWNIDLNLGHFLGKCR